MIINASFVCIFLPNQHYIHIVVMGGRLIDFYFLGQGEELKKQIGAVAYIECSAKTQQVCHPRIRVTYDYICPSILMQPYTQSPNLVINKNKSFDLQYLLCHMVIRQLHSEQAPTHTSSKSNRISLENSFKLKGTSQKTLLFSSDAECEGCLRCCDKGGPSPSETQETKEKVQIMPPTLENDMLLENHSNGEAILCFAYFGIDLRDLVFCFLLCCPFSVINIMLSLPRCSLFFHFLPCDYTHATFHFLSNEFV